MPVKEAPGRTGVLLSAATLFVDEGYPSATLRRIADEAGIKAGSIYHHFSSKDALFAEVLDLGIEVMVTAFDEVAAVVGDHERRARLHAHVRAHLGALFEHGPFTTCHVTAFFTAPPSVRAEAIGRRDDYESRWTALLGDLLPALAEDQLRLHRLLLMGALNATIEWFHPEGTIGLDVLAATVTDQFLNGVTEST